MPSATKYLIHLTISQRYNQILVVSSVLSTGESARGADDVVIVSRISDRKSLRFKTSDGRSFRARRYLPLGKGDCIFLGDDELRVLVKRDNCWIDIFDPWENKTDLEIFGKIIPIRFKEIETEEEIEHFSLLQDLHYRGGGGAGRAVPIIAKSSVWDLPSVLGFIEISSSMIANSARKRFFDFPYKEDSEFLWREWDRVAARKYSNIICRISRFVIHPELRGIGLAKSFTKAALLYARDRWHFGGFRPRFLEITADMLRYYRFLSRQFVFIGETEGNAHRVQKDMKYLVRRALAVKGMPQGGGGIMTLQRSYAKSLLKYSESISTALPDIINSLKFDPSRLDQETWEALHRLNRRPKPVYVAGISQKPREYLSVRAKSLGLRSSKSIKPLPPCRKGVERLKLLGSRNG